MEGRKKTICSVFHQQILSGNEKTMERMPDEVMVDVLRYLEIEQLLDCRLVSKRIKDLVAHPRVWCDRYLDDRDPYVNQVLCLAPCIKEMRLDTKNIGSRRTRQPPFATTRCAVEELVLDVHPGGAVLAALVVRNQDMLGRLRRVELHCNPADADAPLLMETVASTAMAKLVVRQRLSEPLTDTATVLYKETLSTPSLLSFYCDLTLDSEDLAVFILSGHSDTLEEVDFCPTDDLHAPRATYYSAFGTTFTSSEIADQLAAMPKLASLRSPLLPGMSALAASSSLRDVQLAVCDDMSPTVVKEAAEFLLRCPHLREVTLTYVNGKASEVTATLIQALGPSVVWLTLRDGPRPCRSKEPGYRPQCALPALPELPETLQQLKVAAASWHTGTPDALLQSIKAPTLRSLYLCEEEWVGVPCAHAWLHKDAVTTVLTANPQLQLCVPLIPQRCPESDLTCAACENCKISPASECHRFSARVTSCK